MPSASSVLSQQPYHQPALPCSSEKSFAELAQMPPAQVTGAAASTAVRASPMGGRRASVIGASAPAPVYRYGASRGPFASSNTMSSMSAWGRSRVRSSFFFGNSGGGYIARAFADAWPQIRNETLQIVGIRKQISG